MVIGANLGGVVIPFDLLSIADGPARLVVISNLAARGRITPVFLAMLLLGLFRPLFPLFAAGEMAINLHIALNASALLIALQA